MKTIEVTVAKDGSTNVETKGFAGSECQQASRFVEDALGVKTAERLTPEFYATGGVQQEAQQGHS